MDKMEKAIRKAFAKFNRKGFADWLWRGLSKFYSLPPSDRALAFDYVGYFIMQQESICEGLARTYEEYVPKSKQMMFRQAIGDVLLERGNMDNAPVDAFRDLIYLTIRINATEPLSALLPTVGNGLLGKRDPEIFYGTIAALKSLMPSAQVYETTYHLIGSANFDDGYLIEAINVLVECEPSRATDIVSKLVSRLKRLQNVTKKLGGDEWTAFCEAVAFSREEVRLAIEKL